MARRWRQAAQDANAKPVLTMAEQKELEKLRAQDQREIKALKKELQRKEKALAEAAALVWTPFSKSSNCSDSRKWSVASRMGGYQHLHTKRPWQEGPRGEIHMPRD